MRMDFSKLTIRDEAFTKENFSLAKDKNGVLKTIPVPDNLSDYYNFGDYISHQSDKKTLLNGIYNLVKTWMFKKKLNSIIKYSEKVNSVLDYGCGTGDFVNYLESKKIIAEGVEPTPVAFQKAKEKGLSIYRDIDDVNRKYDIITLFHVLEHVDDYEKTIKDLLLKLNQSGLVLIAVPNHKSYDANYYKEKWAAWDVPRHLWHFNKVNIKNIAAKHNLELIKIKPLPFDAFYISMVSESYKGNSKVLGLWRGLISNLKALKSKEYSSHLFILRYKPAND